MMIGKETVQLSKRQAELLLHTAEVGKVAYSQLMPDREMNGRTRTIFSLCDKGLLQHAPRVGGWDNYVHVLTARGMEVALRLALSLLETERLKNETPEQTRFRKFGV